MAESKDSQRWWRYDVNVLILAVVVVLLSILMQPSTSELTVLGYALPPMCAYKVLLGYECLGCGLTRSFVYLGHLELQAAWEMNKMGPFLFAFTLFQFPYRVYRLSRRRRLSRAS